MMLRFYIAVAMGLVLISAACHAEDWSLSTWHQGPRSQAAYEGSSVAHAALRWRETRRRARSERRHAHETVAYYRAPEGPPRHVHCKAPVRGLGTQWIGVAGAMEAARKDWMERVRYDLGESYLDMTHAAAEVSRCGRVSIGEVVGQVTYRCEIIARPCRGAFGSSAAEK